jgi:hypothetical protein
MISAPVEDKSKILCSKEHCTGSYPETLQYCTQLSTPFLSVKFECGTGSSVLQAVGHSPLTAEARTWCKSTWCLLWTDIGINFSLSIWSLPWQYQSGCGGHTASYTVGTRSFPGIRRLERDVNHPPSSGVEVKERVELYLYCLSLPSWQIIEWTLPFTCQYHSTNALCSLVYHRR